MVDPRLGPWGDAYATSVLLPCKNPPPDDCNKSEVPVNTNNAKYPLSTVERIKRWVIKPNEVAQFQDVWNLPFDPDSDDILPPMRPLKAYMEDHTIPFRYESDLTARLESSILGDARRVMKYIGATAATRLAQKKPLFKHPNHCVLIPDHGGVAWTTQFRPDLCSIKANIVDLQRSYCPGEIKPSWKFAGRWAALGETLGSSTLLEPVRQVLAQEKYYMMDIALHPFVDADTGETTLKSAVYGYILTDEEIVLVKRDLKTKRSIYVSPAYPLRPVPTEGFERAQPRQGEAIMSGMKALIYILLLAGHPDGLSSNRLE